MSFYPLFQFSCLSDQSSAWYRTSAYLKVLSRVHFFHNFIYPYWNGLIQSYSLNTHPYSQYYILNQHLSTDFHSAFQMFANIQVAHTSLRFFKRLLTCTHLSLFLFLSYLFQQQSFSLLFQFPLPLTIYLATSPVKCLYLDVLHLFFPFKTHCPFPSILLQQSHNWSPYL